MTLRPMTTALPWALASLFLAAPAGLAAQLSDTEAVIAVIEGFHSAVASGDSTTALAYLADDVTILEGGGVENKESYRTGHLSGDMRFAQAVPRDRSEVRVGVLGDAAWAYSTSVTQGRMGEREINSRGAELVVLVREDGSWKIKAIQWSSRRRGGG
jgi:ketosteroid isomerase-like protein